MSGEAYDYSQFDDVAILNAARIAASIFEKEGWTYHLDPEDASFVPNGIELYEFLQRFVGQLEPGRDHARVSGRWRVERDVDGSLEIFLNVGSGWGVHIEEANWGWLQ